MSQPSTPSSTARAVVYCTALLAGAALILTGRGAAQEVVTLTVVLLAAYDQRAAAPGA
ncbi:hypothetical protein LHJ74_14575 [Streptomyces sp. N2-109]|uniref:Uncharacterized protein n=1 Tax=Streptomyces gossypii TaxID=2883101 RepID=A0ABT2JT98_9ACTN|nr:hypothetical protein [Streptomyces gossypii]MCT2591118.1 hypothetical protein [Streptomyces gossypii]